MVNVLLHQCCRAQIDSSRKSGRRAVMRPFVKRSIRESDREMLRPVTEKASGDKESKKRARNCEDGASEW